VATEPARRVPVRHSDEFFSPISKNNAFEMSSARDDVSIARASLAGRLSRDGGFAETSAMFATGYTFGDTESIA
jgi:hypothetical protein